MITDSLSIVLPAYNEEKRILPTLEAYSKHFLNVTKDFELIVVVNNSNDKTFDIAMEFKDTHHFVKVVNIKKKVGKGGAIISGLKKAKGDILGFMDADDAFALEDISKLLEEIADGRIDVGIASKWKGKHIWEVDEPLSRKILSRGWNLLVRFLLHLHYSDTQAGAKFFTKDAWEQIPKDFIGRGFEFDADILSRFYEQGFRIKEFYVRNKYKEMSKFKIRNSWEMFINLFYIAIRKRPQHPAYYYMAYKDWWRLTHFFYKRKIDKIASFIPLNSIVLDAGCGSGVLPYVLSRKKHCELIGIDVREDQIRIAKRLCPEGSFIQGDLLNLNLGRKFPVINCSDVIEHFNQIDRKLALWNLDEHLESGGRMILAFPSWLYMSAFEKPWKIFRRIIYPFRSFDDEIHSYVPAKEIISFYKNRNYSLLKKGRIGFGLINYLVFRKG